MKIKYYVENEKGEKVLVRSSANEYKYALVDIKDINEGKKGIYCCSADYNRVLTQYNYFKKVYTSNANYGMSKGDIEEYKKHMENLNNLKIVELVRGC